VPRRDILTLDRVLPREGTTVIEADHAKPLAAVIRAALAAEEKP
jgi:hypothetical protein